MWREIGWHCRAAMDRDPASAGEVFATVSASPGFNGLKAHERQLLYDVLTPDLLGTARLARIGLMRRALDHHSRLASLNVDDLRAFLQRPFFETHNSTTVTAPPAGLPFTVTAGGPVEVDREAGTIRAQRWLVNIDGQQIEILMTRRFQGLAAVEEVAAALARMPRNARTALWRVVLEPDEGLLATSAGQTHPDGSVTLFPPSARSFDRLYTILMHESGHVVHQALWPEDRQQLWFQAIESDPITASGYAVANGDEDFAESWASVWGASGAEAEQARRLLPARARLLDDDFGQSQLDVKRAHLLYRNGLVHPYGTSEDVRAMVERLRGMSDSDCEELLAMLRQSERAVPTEAP